MKNKLFNLIFENEEEIKDLEEEEVESGNRTRLSKESVDKQIDSILINFESESLIESEDEESNDINESLSRKSLKYLLEQEEAEALDIADVEEGEEEKKIDLDQFASKVARLTKNYETKLDIRTVIANRAKQMLQEAYDKDHVEKFKAILEEEYDITFTSRDEDETVDIPQGLGAFAGGTGGGGAG